jgi:hypothetical protein
MPETSGGELPEEAPSPSSPAKEGNTSKDPVKGDKKGQVSLAMAANVAKNLAQQGLNAAISNIGLATGNYYAQARVEKALEVGSTVASLGVASANIYSFIATVGGMAISGVSKLYAETKQREHENYQTEQYARRLGYTIGRR